MPERESGSATALGSYSEAPYIENPYSINGTNAPALQNSRFIKVGPGQRIQRRNLASYRHTPIRRLSNFSHAAEARTHSCDTVDVRGIDARASFTQMLCAAASAMSLTGAPARACPSEGYARRAPTEWEMRCVRTELFPCQSLITISAGYVLSTLDAKANREPGLLC